MKKIDYLGEPDEEDEEEIEDLPLEMEEEEEDEENKLKAEPILDEIDYPNSDEKSNINSPEICEIRIGEIKISLGSSVINAEGLNLLAMKSLFSIQKKFLINKKGTGYIS